MNIASLQAMNGMKLQTVSNNAQSGQSATNSFGSIFSSIAGGTFPLAVGTNSEAIDSSVSAESILALFHATSLEDLDSEIEIDSITNLSNLEGFSSLLPLLEKAGLAEDELILLANSTDFWMYLNAIDKLAPRFFSQLTDALEGKSDISKQQAVDLLIILKTAEIVAPKTDLLMKQEQQVFSLQSYLAIAGEHFENVLNSQSSAKNGMVQLMGAKHVVQSGIQADKGPELSQQTLGSIAGSVIVAKAEITNTELENRNNSRNETLIKEMQNIFKRSNFGQTGGMNRLLIKLYPEHLGQVRIELLQNNGIMTARILASTALGKEMLDSQLHQLRSAFLQQNLQVERIDISQTLQDAAKNDREHAFNQHFKKESEDTEDKHEQNDEEVMTFQEYMIELEA